MCLIAFAYNAHPVYRWVVAANRDEWYARPTAPLSAWGDAPHILAGRDLKGMGTWMGVSLAGRFAALTNYREPTSGTNALAPSRGELVRDFLLSTQSSHAFTSQLAVRSDQFASFNLLTDDGTELAWCGHRRGNDLIQAVLEPGHYGLSNGELDAPWPKVMRAKSALASALDEHGSNPDRLVESLLTMLADPTPAPEAALPMTGVPLAWERALSPVFIDAQQTPLAAPYGTRASTALLLTHDGFGRMVEVTHQPHAARADHAFRLRAFCGA